MPGCRPAGVVPIQTGNQHHDYNQAICGERRVFASAICLSSSAPCAPSWSMMAVVVCTMALAALLRPSPVLRGVSRHPPAQLLLTPEPKGPSEGRMGTRSGALRLPPRSAQMLQRQLAQQLPAGEEDETEEPFDLKVRYYIELKTQAVLNGRRPLRALVTNASMATASPTWMRSSSSQHHTGRCTAPGRPSAPRLRSRASRTGSSIAWSSASSTPTGSPGRSSTVCRCWASSSARWRCWRATHTASRPPTASRSSGGGHSEPGRSATASAR